MMTKIGVTTKIQSDMLQEIADERLKQEYKWGIQHLPGRLWFTILSEEVGEVAKELNEYKDYLDDPCFIKKIKEELIQVAAVAVAWLEDLERNKH